MSLEDDQDEGGGKSGGARGECIDSGLSAVGDEGSSSRRSPADPCVDDHPRQRRHKGNTADPGLSFNSSRRKEPHEFSRSWRPDCKVNTRLAPRFLEMDCSRTVKPDDFRDKITMGLVS